MSNDFISLIGGDKLILPLKWNVTSLSDHMGVFRSGTSISPSDFTSEGVEVIPKRAISDSTRYKVSDDDQQYVSEEFVEKNKNAMIEKEFLITALRDLVPSGPNIGRAVRIDDDKKRLMAQGTYSFKLKPSLIPLFYAYISNVDYFRAQMRAIMVGSTQVHIRSGEYLSTPFIIPEVQVQQKIVKILTIVDNLIEQTQTLIDKYTAIKQGMMTDLFTRGIDLSGTPETNPNHGQLRLSFEEAPEHYKETRLGWVPREWGVGSFSDKGIDLVDGDRGSNYPNQNDFTTQGYCLFLSAKNVTKNGFHWGNSQFISETKHDLLGSGAVLLNDIVITTRGTVGNIAHYSDDSKFYAVRINSGMLIIRNTSEKISSEFLYLLYSEYAFRIEYLKVASGSAQPQLPAKDFGKFHIFYPSVIEQRLIVAKAKSIKLRIKKERVMIQKLKLQKKGLMQDLLTGKVHVNA